jgi:hypothetical protein
MVSYSGSGDSVKDPIVISDVKTDFEAVKAEHAYLARRFGRLGVDWKLILQTLLSSEGKQMDSIEVELSDGRHLTLYFDISKYFGVFGERDVSSQSPRRKKRLSQ